MTSSFSLLLTAKPSPPSRLGKVLWSRVLLPGLQKMITKGDLSIVFLDGSVTRLGDGSGTQIEARILDEHFLWRALLDPGMGLADAYIDGDIHVSPDIGDLLRIFLQNKPEGDDAASPEAWLPMRLVSPIAKRYYAWLHSQRANSHEGSQKNIAAHYDLSNGMFELFLSADMTYSAGIFDEEVEALQRSGGGSRDFLQVAQQKKLDRMLDLIDLTEGDSVLEIGCGWGSMAMRAVARCPMLKSWTAITLSKEQLTLAADRIRAAGMQDKIQVVFCDYRDAAAMFGAGAFTKVVSCEMIEAVGHDYLPEYFAAIDECLCPGGKASIQAICVPDARYESYRKGSDFIRERIFPGSHLPSLQEIERACSKARTSLVPCAEPYSVGKSYAKTLHEWRRRFAEHEESIRSEVSTFGQGFDDRFIRQWHYYFAYCEVGFDEGHIDDWQICLQKKAQTDVGRTSRLRASGSFDGDVLHKSRTRFLPRACGFLHALVRPKETLMRLGITYAQRLLDRGLMPDRLVRFGIRLKLAQKLKEESSGCVQRDQAAKLEFVESLQRMPIAILTAEANEQHYEVPLEFYHLCLGPRKKYSACTFPDGAATSLAAKAGELLQAAEARSLEQYVERAELQDGMSILDLGCGWGSVSLFLAQRFPRALVVGASNSHGQRHWIVREAEKLGINNLRVVTCDVSKVPLAEAALPALLSERPDVLGFDRVVSVEMMEHMKNYDALFEEVADVLRPGGKLFVHIFAHTRFAYHFAAQSEADWMARYFFAGGTMPSADLLLYFQRCLRLQKHWHVSGRHYQLTAEGWLQNMDKHAERVREQLRKTYPEGTELTWFNRWRAFFMASSELFGYNNGNEWIVAHYLFEKPATAA